MHFLITGHTGFKGSWLTELLFQLGHSVSGISFETDRNSIYSISTTKSRLTYDLNVDIRSRHELEDATKKIAPDFVVHLAAQALVRKSYLDPTGTFDTNFTGTMNVMLAAEAAASVKGILVITTDKVYENNNSGKPFSEADKLGVNDPYSASKAAADFYAQSFASFSPLKTVIVRAGNVIGGGDVCKDRLVPDVIEKIRSQQGLKLRYPEAVRPWQHVLDCLDGYLTILANWKNVPDGSIWNVGPDPTYQLKVIDLVKNIYDQFNISPKISFENEGTYKEALALTLDVSKIKKLLNHSCRLTLDETIQWTTDFYKRVWAGEQSPHVIEAQVREYLLNKSKTPFENLKVEQFF